MVIDEREAIVYNQHFKAADLQMLKKNEEKNYGKYWSSYDQWRNLLLLIP